MLRTAGAKNQNVQRALALALVGALAASSCGGDGEPATPQAPTGASSEAAPEVASAGEAEAAEEEPQRRPLPRFDGRTLQGEPFALSDQIGRRTLLFIFDASRDEAEAAARAVAQIAPERGAHNFQILGFAVGTDESAARELTRKHGFDFPVVADSAASFPTRIGISASLFFVGADAHGDLDFVSSGQAPPDLPDPAGWLERQLRRALRLPGGEPPVEPTLGLRPEAPSFRAPRLDRREELDLNTYRGRPVVLIFFLHTCPHCHDAMRFLKEQFDAMPDDARPQLIGVSVQNRRAAVNKMLRDEDLDFFPVVSDPDQAIRNAYGVFGGVPDLFLIDRDGRIAHHSVGWAGKRDAALMRMWIAQLAGQPVPLLLSRSGYSGNDTCAICHPSEHATWLLTPHATAYDTLVRHGVEKDPECIGCHVVGWERAGGFSLAEPVSHLEDVGCETCHGRGGPHLSPDFVQHDNYEATCQGCHDPKHSLGFRYATFLPQISHAANAHLLELSVEEKRQLLAERGGAVRDDLLPTQAAYVGSERCQSCHPAETETWSQSPHANALASLEADGESGNPDCLVCHTTAFGRPGGFPADARAEEHADLARVGCESCHGPGGDHVGDEAVRVGTIVSLGDKCDSCVILQICGSCHDDANDPGFEFEVLAKIEAQRHGTITPSSEAESGSDDDAAEESPGTALRSDLELLRQAFAQVDGASARPQ